MIPAFFAGFVPKFLRGLIVFYALSGKAIPIEKTELDVILGSAAWIAASFAAAKIKMRMKMLH